MAADDLEEIKRSLNYVSAELSKVTSQQDRLLRLMKEVKELKILPIERDKKNIYCRAES